MIARLLIVVALAAAVVTAWSGLLAPVKRETLRALGLFETSGLRLRTPAVPRAHTPRGAAGEVFRQQEG